MPNTLGRTKKPGGDVAFEMQPEYVMSTDDLVSFTWYHLRHTPKDWARFREQVWVVAAVLLIFALIGVVFGGPAAYIAILVGLALLWVVARTLGVWLAVRRRAKRYLRDQVGGPQTVVRVVLDEAGFTHVTPDRRLWASWASAPRVERDERTLYLYTNPGVAVVVPQRAFGDQESFHAFCAEAERLWCQARPQVDAGEQQSDVTLSRWRALSDGLATVILFLLAAFVYGLVAMGLHWMMTLGKTSGHVAASASWVFVVDVSWTVLFAVAATVLGSPLPALAAHSGQGRRWRRIALPILLGCLGWPLGNFSIVLVPGALGPTDIRGAVIRGGVAAAASFAFGVVWAVWAARRDGAGS
jgi:hypothetical protein